MNDEHALTNDAIDQLRADHELWLSCDDCFAQVDVVVDAFVARGTAIDGAFRAHLRGCPACRDEARALVALLADDDGVDEAGCARLLTRFDADLAAPASHGLAAAAPPPATVPHSPWQQQLGWVLVVVQFVLLVVLVLLPHRPATVLGLVVGAVLAVLGVVLGLAATRFLGSALTPTPVPVDGAGLRTSGPYARVRHPIYGAVLLLGTGFTVAVGSWWTVGCLVTLVAFFVAKARWEDSLLRTRYGAAWRTWASSTGALLPRLR